MGFIVASGGDTTPALPTLVYPVVNPVTFSESESAWLQGRACRECFAFPRGLTPQMSAIVFFFGLALRECVKEKFRLKSYQGDELIICCNSAIQPSGTSSRAA